MIIAELLSKDFSLFDIVKAVRNKTLVVKLDYLHTFLTPVVMANCKQVSKDWESDDDSPESLDDMKPTDKVEVTGKLRSMVEQILGPLQHRAFSITCEWTRVEIKTVEIKRDDRCVLSERPVPRTALATVQKIVPEEDL